MKKYLPIVTTLLIIPSVAFASWWNPTTWFSSTNTTNSTSTISATDQQLLDRVNKLQQEVSQEQLQSVATITPTITNTTDNSKTQSNISTLTAENSALESKVSNLQTELQTVQSNYNICQTNLKTAQNQAQQSNPASTVQTNKSNSAILSLDPKNPNSSAGGVNGQVSALLLAFDIQPSSVGQSISTLTVDINSSIPGNSSINTVSLYSGNPNIPNSGASLIATASVINGVAKFSNIQNNSSVVQSIIAPLRFPSASFNTFSVGVDISGLENVSNNGTITASVSNIDIVDPNGQNVTVTGTAQGNTINITNYNTIP